MLPNPNQRKRNQRDRIQNKNRRKRNRSLLFIRLNDWSDRGNGAAAANRGSRRDQIRSVAAHLQKFPERQSNNERERNSQRGVNESTFAGFDHFVQVHAKAKRDDAGLQQKA